MSEYQYFEFQAIDRSLTDKEMNELRNFSTRADITPNSFVNEYSWGNFKGDEDLWMEKYFDGFLYYANWGTHILKLRLPSAYLDLKTVQTYCNDDSFSARLSKDKIILDFVSENEGGEWEEGWHLAPFLSLRTELIRGDLRCLYLGWLSHVQNEEYEEEELEPPVPPGLAQLSPALMKLVEFLRIDSDLIEAASKMSLSLEEATPSSNDLRSWLTALPVSEKENCLSNILEGSLKGDQTATIQLAHHFNKAWQSQQSNKMGKQGRQRTIAELLKEAEYASQERQRIAAEKAAEKQRLQRLAREKQLNKMAGQEPILWNQIESLVSEKKATSYDKAIELLLDLRDLAARGNGREFLLKFDRLKQRHSGKSSFIGRLRNLDLGESKTNI
jgi:hypothetical protein